MYIASSYDETKKRAHDLDIVRAKEILMLSHGGHTAKDKHQAPTNGLKLRARAVNESKA